MLFKSSLKVKQTSMDYLDTITSFEAMEVEVEVNSQIVSILVVYRPPPSSANNFSTSLFMNEFSSLLESYIINTGSLLIAGDFNFHVNDTSDALIPFYLILLVTYKSFSTSIIQNYLAYLINMHHLNRAWLPSALLLHGSVKRSNWREEFVIGLKGNGEGVGYLKMAYVSLSKTVLSISCYFLPALSITPSLLMKTALIRGNCLALLANCCIVILHRYIPPALLRRIWRIISLASLPTK